MLRNLAKNCKVLPYDTYHVDGPQEILMACIHKPGVSGLRQHSIQSGLPNLGDEVSLASILQQGIPCFLADHHDQVA